MLAYIHSIGPDCEMDDTEVFTVDFGDEPADLDPEDMTTEERDEYVMRRIVAQNEREAARNFAYYKEEA